MRPTVETRRSSGSLTALWKLTGLVGDGDFTHVHVIDDLPHDLDRTRRARHDAGAQRAKIEAREIRMIEFGNEHRRHAIESRAFLGLNGFERRKRVEALAGI